MKRIISVFLAVAMIISVVPAAPASAQGGTFGFGLTWVLSEILSLYPATAI